jgi:hypothetical protein
VRAAAPITPSTHQNAAKRHPPRPKARPQPPPGPPRAALAIGSFLYYSYTPEAPPGPRPEPHLNVPQQRQAAPFQLRLVVALSRHVLYDVVREDVSQQPVLRLQHRSQERLGTDLHPAPRQGPPDTFW